MFGHETRTSLDIVYGRPPDADLSTATYSSYTQDFAESVETAYRMVREQLKIMAERRRHTYDLRVRPSEFKLGTHVWYFTPRRYQR